MLHSHQYEVSILFHELKRCKYCFVQEHFFFWRYCTGAVTKKKCLLDTAHTCIFANIRATIHKLWIVTSWLVKLIDTISTLKLYVTPDSILPVAFTTDTVVGT